MRILGVTIGPELTHKSKFEVIRRKLVNSVKKLMNIEIRT